MGTVRTVAVEETEVVEEAEVVEETEVAAVVVAVEAVGVNTSRLQCVGHTERERERAEKIYTVLEYNF